MAVSPGRVVALASVAVAVLLLAVAFFQPWWGLGRDFGGSREWERYGPFHRDDEAPRGYYRGPVLLLGTLAASALVLLGAATVLHVTHLVRGGGRFRWPVIVTLLGVAAALAAALYPVWAFPAEANRAQSTDLAFIDRDCTGRFVSTFCYLARPAAGWYLAAAAAVLPALGLVAGRRAGPAEAEPAGRASTVRIAAPGTGPAPPPTPGLGVPPGTTKVLKCPQCQTRLSYVGRGPGPTMVACHNCGLRFPA